MAGVVFVFSKLFFQCLFPMFFFFLIRFFFSKAFFFQKVFSEETKLQNKNKEMAFSKITKVFLLFFLNTTKMTGNA